MLTLPVPRGPLTAVLVEELRDRAHRLPAIAVRRPEDPLADDDLQLALYLLYELHYRGVPGVDDDWEWEPSLIALRNHLESIYLDALHELVGPPAGDAKPEEMDLALRAIEEDDDSPSLSQFVAREATAQQVREFLVHRSAYQLKEADPHSWALPRLHGAPKAAMVEIQADEYGGGRPERIHARLFADAMDAFGLDSTYGGYVDHIPGITLATVNLMSLFGLHRRWRGAIVGHLALFEMSSSIPNRRYADGIRRLGLDEDPRAVEFFDEHVEADAVHEAVAAVDLAGGLARQDPSLTKDVLHGARCLVAVEGRWAAHVLGCWERGEPSLLLPLGDLELAA